MALRELLAQFDVKVTGAEALASVDKQLANTAAGSATLLAALDALKGAFAALVGAGIIVAAKQMFDWVAGVSAAADPINDLSEQIGVSTDSIQKWNNVALEAGAGADVIVKGFRTVAKTVSAAAGGNADAAKSFKDLGLNAKELATLPLDDQLLEVAAAVGAITDPAKKLNVATEMFGKNAIKLIPALKGNREEMAAYLESMVDLHGIMSEQFIKDAAAANDELDRMKNQWQVLKTTVAMAFLPAFRQVIDFFSKGYMGIRKFLQETQLLKRAFLLSGLVGFTGLIGALVKNFTLVWRVASRFAGVVMRFARVLAPWLAWALILDDIIVFLQGGDSALGRLIDHLFGAGAAAKTLEFIKEAAAAVWEELKAAGVWLAALWEQFRDSGAAADWGQFLLDMLNLVALAVQFLMSTIAGFMVLVSMAFGKHTPEQLAELQDTFMRVTQSIGDFFDAMFGGIASAASIAWENIKAGAADLVNALSTPLRMVGQLLGMGEDFAKVDWGEYGMGPDTPAKVKQKVFSASDSVDAANLLTGQGQYNPSNPYAPTVTGGDANVTVNLSGNPSAETVKYTTAEAKAAAADLLGVTNKPLAYGTVRGGF